MTPKFTADRFLRLLFPWRTARVVEQLAGETARQCRAGLWQRVCRRSENMSMAEIRGYARAQAAGCVADEVDRAFSSRHLDAALRGRIVEAAVDQLITMVAHDALSIEPSLHAKTMAA